jgi:peptidoglycan hydrolase-like protein with peptidoglycan-binding domain
MAKPTIKLGSKGDAVKEWQAIVGVKPDGSFGAETESATKNWQQRHKLVPDGVVGALSWSAALGTSVPTTVQPSASASTDKWAYDLSKRVTPELTEAERQYVLAVGRHEGFYGKAQKPPVWIGSNNWGAVQGVGSAGSFSTTDYHADGAAYAGKFKKYATPEEGYKDLVRILLKPNVRAALAKNGSIKDASTAQRANRYYEAPQVKYQEALVRNYNQIAANIGLPRVLSETGKTAVAAVASYIAGTAAVAIGILSWAFLTKRI